MFDDTVGSLEQLQRKIAYSIEHTIGIRVAVRLVKPQTIERRPGQGQARDRSAQHERMTQRPIGIGKSIKEGKVDS